MKLPSRLFLRNVMPGEVDQSGMTELHVACEVGRSENVEVLLNYAFKGRTLLYLEKYYEGYVVSNKITVYQ